LGLKSLRGKRISFRHTEHCWRMKGLFSFGTSLLQFTQDSVEFVGGGELFLEFFAG
jgi:hypothetical protein